MAEPDDREPQAAEHRSRREHLRPRLLIRYTLLQLPGTLLLILVVVGIRRFWDFPTWAAVTVVAMWVAKDAFLYPFLWRAYDWDRESENFTMVGREGTVVKRLDPSGYVRVRGELWKAGVEEGRPPVEKGRTVQVLAVRGLRLVVRRRE